MDRDHLMSLAAKTTPSSSPLSNHIMKKFIARGTKGSPTHSPLMKSLAQMGTPQSTPTNSTATKSSSKSGNITLMENRMAKYSLNKAKAVKKKKTATLRYPIDASHTSDASVMIFSAVIFEAARHMLPDMYLSQGYFIFWSQTFDQLDRVVTDVLKIFAPNTQGDVDKNNKIAVIHIYRTESKIMVQGQHRPTFEEDFYPVLQEMVEELYNKDSEVQIYWMLNAINISQFNTFDPTEQDSDQDLDNLPMIHGSTKTVHMFGEESSPKGSESSEITNDDNSESDQSSEVMFKHIMNDLSHTDDGTLQIRETNNTKHIGCKSNSSGEDSVSTEVQASAEDDKHHSSGNVRLAPTHIGDDNCKKLTTEVQDSANINKHDTVTSPPQQKEEITEPIITGHDTLTNDVSVQIQDSSSEEPKVTCTNDTVDDHTDSTCTVSNGNQISSDHESETNEVFTDTENTCITPEESKGDQILSEEDHSDEPVTTGQDTRNNDESVQVQDSSNDEEKAAVDIHVQAKQANIRKETQVKIAGVTSNICDCSDSITDLFKDFQNQIKIVLETKDDRIWSLEKQILEREIVGLKKEVTGIQRKATEKDEEMKKSDKHLREKDSMLLKMQKQIDAEMKKGDKHLREKDSMLLKMQKQIDDLSAQKDHMQEGTTSTHQKEAPTNSKVKDVTLKQGHASTATDGVVDLKCDCDAQIQRKQKECDELRERYTQTADLLANRQRAIVDREIDIGRRLEELNSLKIDKEEARINSSDNNHVPKVAESIQKSETPRHIHQIPRGNTRYVKGPQDILSNFAPCTFTYKDKMFVNGEQAYQFHKLMHDGHDDIAKKVMSLTDPYMMKKEGDGIRDSRDWLERKVHVMKAILKEKFKASSAKEKLISTFPSPIKHNVMNSFWGTGKDENGEDRFGKLLMDLRDELIAQTDSAIPLTNETPQKEQSANSTNKDVLILGHSHFNGFNPTYVKDINMDLKQLYTIREAKEFVQKHKLPPTTIIHLITNDLKAPNASVDECVESIYDLVEAATSLHQTEVIISLPPPSQRVSHNRKMDEVKDTLRGDPSLNIIDHTNSFMYRGQIDKSLYKDPSPRRFGG